MQLSNDNRGLSDKTKFWRTYLLQLHLWTGTLASSELYKWNSQEPCHGTLQDIEFTGEYRCSSGRRNSKQDVNCPCSSGHLTLLPCCYSEAIMHAAEERIEFKNFKTIDGNYDQWTIERHVQECTANSIFSHETRRLELTILSDSMGTSRPMERRNLWRLSRNILETGTGKRRTGKVQDNNELSKGSYKEKKEQKKCTTRVYSKRKEKCWRRTVIEQDTEPGWKVRQSPPDLVGSVAVVPNDWGNTGNSSWGDCKTSTSKFHIELIRALTWSLLGVSTREWLPWKQVELEEKIANSLV